MQVDQEKLEETAMALLYLTIHHHDGVPRAWKGLDWELLSALHFRGWISDPVSKAKSVALTPEGMTAAELLFRKHFKTDK